MLNSDIAGFSTLSQNMAAEELVKFLNDYFGRMIDIVLANGGNVDKFQGDGMLVVFGAPVPMADHAARAVNAVKEMLREIDKFNGDLTAKGQAPIRVGFGLDSGEVVAGHVGSEKRLEFTLIGVPVNNSAYLSKVRPPRVLMSESTRNAVPAGEGVVEYEPMLLKGAREKQPIFQLEVTPVRAKA
jgi:adenylate cyclase